MKRSWNASSSVRRTVLMFEMLSETASSHLRWTMRPDPEIPRVSNMSLRPERGAHDVVLAVERVERQLVPQAGFGGDEGLRIEVDVVAVGVRRLEGPGDRAAGDGRGLTAADGAGQRRLEVHAAGEEAGRVDVRDVVGGDPLALGQAGEGAVQRRHRAVLDQHGTDRRT